MCASKCVFRQLNRKGIKEMKIKCLGVCVTFKRPKAAAREPKMRVLTQPRIAEKFHVHAVCSPACFSTVVLEYMRYIYKTENELFFFASLYIFFRKYNNKQRQQQQPSKRERKRLFLHSSGAFEEKNYVYILSVDNFFNPLDDEQEDDEEIFI